MPHPWSLQSQPHTVAVEEERGIERAPPPRATPRYTPQAGYRLFKITLAGTDAKVKDNEKLMQKNWQCKTLVYGEEKMRSAPW